MLVEQIASVGKQADRIEKVKDNKGLEHVEFKVTEAAIPMPASLPMTCTATIVGDSL
jgi:hypothetical protein